MPNFSNNLIILVRSFDAIARTIHAGMLAWYIVRGKKPRKVYNHAEIYVNDLVSGALPNGVINRSYEKAFEDGKKRELLFYDMDLDDEQKIKLYKFCLDQGGKGYEYINFVRHLIDIFFGKWKGPKGKKAEKRVYCIEYAAMGINEVIPGSIKKPWRINPIQFKKYCDKNFKLMIRNI